MKQLKKIQSTLATILTVVFLIPTAISCSETTEELTSEEALISQYKEIENKYRGEASKMMADLETLNRKFESQEQIQSRNVNGTEVTQEMLDNYAVSIGYEPGMVSLNLFNAVMNDYEDLINNDLDYVVDSKLLNSFTKEKAKQILNSNSHLNDLYTSEFHTLPNSEKEQLIFLNTFAEDLNSTPSGTMGRGQFWDGFTSAGVGFLVGTALCGLGCGVLGFFIGGFIFGISNK